MYYILYIYMCVYLYYTKIITQYYTILLTNLIWSLILAKCLFLFNDRPGIISNHLKKISKHKKNQQQNL